MSSSPIRHHPPSSSPFRDSSETRVEEWMDPEEMRREWGEEYATQNSLLHNLVSLHHLGSIRRAKSSHGGIAPCTDVHSSNTRYDSPIHP